MLNHKANSEPSRVQCKKLASLHHSRASLSGITDHSSKPGFPNQVRFEKGHVLHLLKCLLKKLELEQVKAVYFTSEEQTIIMDYFKEFKHKPVITVLSTLLTILPRSIRTSVHSQGLITVS